MIPFLVPQKQLLAANGVFTLTLNAAFAIGFALLGPVVVDAVRRAGADPHRGRLLLRRRRVLLDAAVDAADRGPRGARPVTAWPTTRSRPLGSTLVQLREGITFIRGHRSISWSLTYLAIAASLVGVLGVLGPGFATDSLGLEPEGLRGHRAPARVRHRDGDPAPELVRPHLRRGAGSSRSGSSRSGILIVLLAIAGPIARFLQRAETATGLGSFADFTSLLAIVVADRPARRDGLRLSSRSRRRRSSRRTSPRTSAAACSASSTCWCRWPASLRSSSSARCPTGRHRERADRRRLHRDAVRLLSIVRRGPMQAREPWSTARST